MKRLFILAICCFIVTSSFSQEKTPLLKRLFPKLTDTIYVHDTVFIMTEPIVEEEEDDEDGAPGNIPMPVDTLDTDDKYRKVFLFDDNTWAYFDINKPNLSDTLDNSYWDTENVHTYRDVNLKNLPDEIDLVLVDSTHAYCIPAKGRVVSEFKYRRRRPHKGVDIDVDTGDPIYAAFDGMVRVALPTRYTGGYGNILVIRHANGLETYYGHLSKYIVNSGDTVSAGELIGYGGSTGRSTGAHLHFETRYMGQSFDPQRIFDFEKGTLRDSIFTLKKHYFSVSSHYGQTDRQSAAAAKSSSDAKYYKVKQGDTLGKIAQKHGTSVRALCRLNGIKETKVLQIGQRLRVR